MYILISLFVYFVTIKHYFIYFIYCEGNFVCSGPAPQRTTESQLTVSYLVERICKKLPSFTLGTLRRQGTGRCFLMSGTIAQALHVLSRAAMLQFITLLAPQRSQESVTALDIDLQHAAVNYKELLL